MLSENPTSVQIRQFRSEDLAQVYELERLSFTDPYPWWLLSELARKNPDTFILAIVEGKVAGYAVVDRWDDDHQYHLVSIAVHPSERRKGLATSMLQALESKLEPGKVLRLEVRETNGAAASFYEKHNFIKTGNIPRYYSDGEGAIIMEKRTVGG